MSDGDMIRNALAMDRALVVDLLGMAHEGSKTWLKWKARLADIDTLIAGSQAVHRKEDVT